MIQPIVLAKLGQLLLSFGLTPDVAFEKARQACYRVATVLATMRSPTRPSTLHRMRTVLIVDDHLEFRVSARSLLEAGGFVVVGDAATGEEAIRETTRLRPAIVLLDIQMPDLDGFVVAQQIVAGRTPPVVILISSRDPGTYGDRLAGSPARGFLRKSSFSAQALTELIA